jgi:hypothetical protein
MKARWEFNPVNQTSQRGEFVRDIMAHKKRTMDRMSHENASVTSSIERDSFSMLNDRLT